MFEIAEIEKVSPFQSLKFAIFLVILIIFISHWAGRIQTPTSEQVQIEILLEEIVFVSLLAYCGAGTLETHLNIPPGQLIGSRSQMVSYECPLEDTAGWIKAILIKVPL